LQPYSEWPKQGKISFVNYSAKYRKELDCVLENLNFDILSGEKIGIVGRSGAGKSSLILGLFRIIHHSTGRIFIDDVDLNKISLGFLRQNLTIIPQVNLILKYIFFIQDSL
jgi:ATP-binding cassette subfamily C (CFTR/MRP) protein 1